MISDSLLNRDFKSPNRDFKSPKANKMGQAYPKRPSVRFDPDIQDQDNIEGYNPMGLGLPSFSPHHGKIRSTTIRGIANKPILEQQELDYNNNPDGQEETD